MLVLATTRANLRRLLSDESVPYTWSDAKLDQYINEATRWLSLGQRPALWTEAIDDTVTTIVDQYEYALPTGFFRVFDIWKETISGDDTSYKLLRNWRVFGGNFQLGIYDRPDEAGLKYRLRGAKKYTVITEVEDEYETIILNYAVSRAFDDISSKMTQFNVYSAKLQNISRNDVRLKAQYHLTLAKQDKQDNKKALKPVYQATGAF